MSGLKSFEDFKPEDSTSIGAIEASEAEMLAFAEAFDPQPFHLDRAAAAASPLKGLAASGWQTCALGARLFAEGVAARAAGCSLLGVERCLWRSPFYPSDRAGPLEASVAMAGPATGAWAKRAPASHGAAAFDLTLRQRPPGQKAQTAPTRLVCEMRIIALIARRAALKPAPPADKAVSSPKAAAATAGPMRSQPGAGLAYATAAEAPIGERLALGEAGFEPDGMLAFSNRFDPRPNLICPSPIASGWHVAAVFMARFVRARAAAIAGLDPSKRAAAIQNAGPSPGFADMIWPAAVTPGDRVAYALTPLAVTPWRGAEHWALLTSLVEAQNQRGQTVMRFEARGLVRP